MNKEQKREQERYERAIVIAEKMAKATNHFDGLCLDTVAQWMVYFVEDEEGVKK